MAKSSMPILVNPAATGAARRGHPWVYRDAITRKVGALESGAVVDVAAPDGEVIGSGLWDADAPIAVRLFTRGHAERLDAALIGRRLEAACALRDDLFGGDDHTTAYRLCNGEGDRVPGLVVDRYAEVAVVRTDGAAMSAWLDRLVSVLSPPLARRGITSIALRVEADPRTGARLRKLHGADVPERILVHEHGMAMEVDLWRGQKTGAFLDQRENRARVRALASAGRALNLFSYAGGFSVAAALGGAAHVTSVDSAAGAHATAQRTFRENDIDPARHAFVTADAFDFLARAAARKERWDLVVSDPPSFAPSERARPRALAAYRKLHAAAAAVLAEGGTFCAASCSSHVDTSSFLSTLDEGALGLPLRLLDVFGQPADHPTMPAWSEGRYLKFARLAR